MHTNISENRTIYRQFAYADAVQTVGENCTDAHIVVQTVAKHGTDVQTVQDYTLQISTP